MKNNRQYKDSATLVFMGFAGILILCILLVLTTLIPGCSEWHQKVGEGIKNDPRPLSPIYNYSHPSAWQDDCNMISDSTHEELMDASGVEKGINKDYPDEYVMWITANGDTIWE